MKREGGGKGRKKGGLWKGKRHGKKKKERRVCYPEKKGQTPLPVLGRKNCPSFLKGGGDTFRQKKEKKEGTPRCLENLKKKKGKGKKKERKGPR